MTAISEAQDGKDARRQSAAPASLYCLSFWLAAESKSPAHAFWLMKTIQWRTPRLTVVLMSDKLSEQLHCYLKNIAMGF